MKYIMIIPILTFVCCKSPMSDDKDKQEIEETRRLLTESALKENGEEVISYVTDDVIFLNPDEKDIVGKENLKYFINHLLDNFISLQVVRHPIEEIEVFNDLAYIRYKNSFDGFLKADSSSIKLDKRFMDIWKKEQGKWKMHRHMNNNLPVN